MEALVAIASFIFIAYMATDSGNNSNNKKQEK